MVAIIREQLVKITENDQGGLLTFGVAAALWSSSAAMVAIISALNRAYDVEDGRPWWKQRATAILLTLGVALFLLVSFALVVVGPQMAEYVAGRFGLGAAVEWTWKIAQWPLVFLLVATGIGLIYHFAPDVDQDYALLTPGSVLATVLWLAGSLGFRLYVVNFGSYNETYGAIGGVIVLMLWFYLTGLVIIVGAEMNAEIEAASPHAADERLRSAGRRRTVGPRAARAFEQRNDAARQPRAAAGPAASHAVPLGALARGGALVTATLALLVGRRV